MRKTLRRIGFASAIAAGAIALTAGPANAEELLSADIDLSFSTADLGVDAQVDTSLGDVNVTSFNNSIDRIG